MRTPTGNVHDLVPAPAQHATPALLRKMLRLSGLSTDITKTQETAWLKALDAQIGFLDQLKCSDSKPANGAVFRLLPADHNPPPPLDLKALMAQVEATQEAGPEDAVDVAGQIRTHIKF